ncbi:MAG: hypothetical protein WCP21_01405 [Armatimonadota bacterium]
MKRALICAVVGLYALTALYAAPQRTLSSQTPVAGLNATILLSDTARVTEFSRLQVAKSIEGAQQTTNLTRFQALPAGLQQAILVAGGSKAAGSHRSLQLQRSNLAVRPGVGGAIYVLRPQISAIWPSDGGNPGTYSLALGSPLSASTKATFNGAVVPSYFVDIPPFLPPSVGFQIPAGATLGASYSVTVQNGAISSNAVNYKIVAPRGYRGYYGWKFANFGDPAIPWTAYADYFGAANVQYGDGTHKPSAQAWFNNHYTGMGGGGNCYGMSVSSLRLKNGASMGYWNSWFTNPANHQADCWLYPNVTQTHQTVQEYQGSWGTEEVLDTTNSLWSSQSARDVFNRAQSLIADPVNKPVLVMAVGNSWWHAVVPYATKVVGDDHQIIVYDNNNPYSETETGSPDPTVAHVYWGANTFSYGSGNKAVMMSYAEVTPTPPHLPGSSYGGPGSATVVAVLTPGTHAQQISDGAGHFFYNADGSENTDPKTRLEGALKLPPLSQRSLTKAELANFPDTYLFGKAEGKSLTFDLAGTGKKGFHFFSRGLVLSLEATGAGQVRAADIQQSTHRLEILNPAALQPTRAQVIATLPTGDRLFEVTNLRNLGTNMLRFAPSPASDSLEIQGAPNPLFDLNLQGAVGRGAETANFAGLALTQGTKAVVAPASWARLRAGALQLQLRGIQSNALQNERLIQPR